MSKRKTMEDETVGKETDFKKLPRVEQDVGAIVWSGATSKEVAEIFKKPSVWEDITHGRYRDVFHAAGEFFPKGMERKTELRATGPKCNVQLVHVSAEEQAWTEAQHRWAEEWKRSCFVCKQVFAVNHDVVYDYWVRMWQNGPWSESIPPAGEFWQQIMEDNSYGWKYARVRFSPEKQRHPHAFFLELVASPRTPLCWACEKELK